MAASASFAALLQAYQAALYEVEVNAQLFVIRIGQPLAAAIDAHLAARGVDVAAFLTAANPGSRRCGAKENAKRHAELLQALAELRVPWLRGNGRDANGEWPAEPSVLALGLERQQAMRLAEQFEQNAYVEVARGMPARLVLTAHWGTASELP